MKKWPGQVQKFTYSLMNQDLATSSRTFTDLLKNLPRQALANLFPLTLLVLKFSQWWYSPSSPRLSHAESGGSEGRVKVTPPAILKPAVKGWTELNEIRQKLEAAEEAEVSEEEGSDDDTDDDSETSSEDLPMTPNKASGELAYGHCPLCALAWTNPTATPTGYIGCYTCLYRFIDRMGICPVTGLDLKGEGGVESLRKVLV
jgi:peroxin-12